MAETPLSEVRASMEWPDVQRGLASGEDAGTEFKRAVGDLRGVGKAVCGFANGNGGLVVIGVDDAGVIVGDGENADTVPGAVGALSGSRLWHAGDGGVRQARGQREVGALGRRASRSARIRGVFLRRSVLGQAGGEARRRRHRPSCRSC